MSRHGRGPRPVRSRTSGLVLGIGVILLGAVLLLDQVPALHQAHLLERLKPLWPLILVAVGAVRIREGRRSAHGWILVVLGLVLLAKTLGHGAIAALIWPAVLLCCGIVLVRHSLRERRLASGADRIEGEPRGRFAPSPSPLGLPHVMSGGEAGPDTGFAASEDSFTGTAILTGIKRRLGSQAFRGGEITAICGGFDLDLRQVRMAGDQARLEVFLLFGGGELRVPEDWEVQLQATTIAGGVSDKGAPAPAGPGPRLVVTGLILFGGCEVRR
jgi:hypothetical protein